MDWIIAIAALFHLFASPFTKVEESFNMQATHDVLYHGTDIYKYDHLEFPGVVPRTFVGPLILSSFSWPVVFLLEIFGVSKIYSQYTVRIILGGFVLIAWRNLRKQIQKSFGKDVAIWFTFITASQFHFVYYLSRTLPNIFALIFALFSYSYWLQQRHKLMLISSGIGVFIFRSELCLLLGPMLLYDLSMRRIHIAKFLTYAIPVGILCLGTTMVVDSFFWNRLIWPEGEVYPLLWYWYSCLPRALGLSFSLRKYGHDPRIKSFYITRTSLCQSLLLLTPQRTTIHYLCPLFNLAAARACQFFWTTRLKSTSRKVFAIASALHIVGNLIFTSLFLSISSHNYPGGVAMQKFHQIIPPNSTVYLHIDNYATQTGVTRFTQLNPNWKYNKTENLKAGGKEIRSFTHILVEAKAKYAYNLKHYTTSHKILDHIEAFSHLHFNYMNFPPVKIRVKPAIYILENKIKEDIDWSFIQSNLEHSDGREILTSVENENLIKENDTKMPTSFPSNGSTIEELQDFHQKIV
ncbi:putative Dol-P-Man:Man(7)GlcNAc(2)-PP-Dol alpha-1,6-mannosyltransferase [Armadillidium nasatum]|uniref:Mannosyltransferase n=1 Tax=Armadillidium nasatum TaxID=96803 RepID=A0A5N5TB41_9CRUS|nr:putative Dol-P-Man:Man(7)GlcNAc(2)-PP-Dol alpha-1,6-mannosyltransferase [Armadillidium nasatum]